MADDPVFLYVAAYAAEDDAREEYEVLKDLHADRRARHVRRRPRSPRTRTARCTCTSMRSRPNTAHGRASASVASSGSSSRPPSSAPPSSAAPRARSSGHLWHGMSRGDMKDLGETLDEGQAALVIVGKSKLEETLDRELKRANEADREADQGGRQGVGEGAQGRRGRPATPVPSASPARSHCGTPPSTTWMTSSAPWRCSRLRGDRGALARSRR